MAATLTHLTQRVLKTYTFMDCDNPLWQAWSEYQFLKANGGSQEAHLAARKLRRELELEQAVKEVLECAA